MHSLKAEKNCNITESALELKSTNYLLKNQVIKLTRTQMISQKLRQFIQTGHR